MSWALIHRTVDFWDRGFFVSWIFSGPWISWAWISWAVDFLGAEDFAADSSSDFFVIFACFERCEFRCGFRCGFCDVDFWLVDFPAWIY